MSAGLCPPSRGELRLLSSSLSSPETSGPKTRSAPPARFHPEDAGCFGPFLVDLKSLQLSKNSPCPSRFALKPVHCSAATAVPSWLWGLPCGPSIVPGDWHLPSEPDPEQDRCGRGCSGLCGPSEVSLSIFTPLPKRGQDGSLVAITQCSCNPQGIWCLWEIGPRLGC